MPSVEGPLLGSTLTQGTNMLQGAFIYVKHKYDYVRKRKKNFEKMEWEFKHLEAKKKDTEKEKKNEEPYMEMTSECEVWIQKIEKIEKEVEKLKTRYEKTHKLLYLVLHFRILPKLGRDIVKMTTELTALKDQRNSIRAMFPKKSEAFGSKLGDANEDKTLSLSENVQELLKYLGYEEVKRIGVWGMPGVGKSTIMKALNDRVFQTDMFEKVIWVKAEEGDTEGKIREEIVASLPVNVQDINRKDHAAACISGALVNMKYLLIVDQVPSHIDLREVGIHRHHKYGKVVIATRSRLDCDKMDLDTLLNVQRLSSDDAFVLFREIVGELVDHSHFKGTAELILKELGGLPQVIKAVATRLKNRDNSHIWNDALFSLQYGKESKLQELAEVRTAFQFLYDGLKDEDMKNCLVYGVLFPKDYKIEKDYLIECWRAEQFIAQAPQDDVQILRKARDEGHTILQYLIDSCLFESCSSEKYVTMPAIFWMVALNITYPQESVVEAGKGIKSFPSLDEKSRRNARRISLMCNKLERLPESPCLECLRESPCCNQISTLLLQENAQLTDIHDSFFYRKAGLRILDLSRTGIVSLPSSIFELVNLKALYLNNCPQLTALPKEIENLKNLELLDIRDTGMGTLPSEIGKLGRLRCLRLSFILKSIPDQDQMQASRMIPTNVIRGLCQLEELIIIVDPRDKNWNAIADEVVSEVASLKRLTTLFFHFPKVKSLETFIVNSKSWNNINTQWKEVSFRSFNFVVGPCKANSSEGFVERYLRCSTGEAIVSSEVQAVLNQCYHFELTDHQGFQNLYVMAYMEALKVCVIKNCDRMKSIVNSNVATGAAIFPYLEKLHLINLGQLNCIWEGPLVAKGFAKLSILVLEECNSLRKVLSRTIIQLLPQLQHLRVENCEKVTDIIEDDSRSEQIVEIQENQDQCDLLSRLEIVELVNLPSLIRICQDEVLNWRGLRTIQVKECSLLKDLSVILRKARLRKIECSKNWWEQLDFKDLGAEKKDSLRCLCDFFTEEPVLLPSHGMPPDEGLDHLQSNFRELGSFVRDKLRSEILEPIIGRPPNDPSSSSSSQLHPSPERRV